MKTNALVNIYVLRIKKQVWLLVLDIKKMILRKSLDLYCELSGDVREMYIEGQCSVYSYTSPSSAIHGAGVTPQIIPLLKLYPSRFWDLPPFSYLVRCLRIPESTPPSQNIPPFSKTICDPSRIYPSLPEYTPLFSTNILLSDASRMYPPSQNTHSPFQQLCGTLPEYTPTSQNIPPFQQIYMCDPPRIYPSLPEYTPLFNNYMHPPRIYPPPLPE